MAVPVALAAVEPVTRPSYASSAVVALVLAMACALLSLARAAGVVSAAVAIVLARRGPRKQRRTVPVAAPCAPPNDAHSGDTLADAFSLVLADATDPAARGWRLEEETCGVKRYLRDAADGGRDAMSVGTVNAPAAAIDAALSRAAAQAPSVVEPLRESIRPLPSSRPLPHLESSGWAPRGSAAVTHIICKRVWPVSQRDMVLVTAAATQGGAYLRFATSASHAAPLDADRVRLEVRGSGYLVEPLDGASSRVTHVSCVAPGDTPQFLVNRIAWQRTAMVFKVRELVCG